MSQEFLRENNNSKQLVNGNISDEDLVIFVREKNKEAYSFIIDRYQKRIGRYIYRLINDQEEANDLTQQALVNAYVNLYKFDEKRKFSSWIYRIAHNLAVNWIRKKKAVISLDYNEVISSKLASEIDTAKEVSRKELNEKLTSLINKLPEKFKEPFILKYIEEKSYNEISDILRMPKNTVGTIISRAKKILKKELEKTYG